MTDSAKSNLIDQGQGDHQILGIIELSRSCSGSDCTSGSPSFPNSVKIYLDPHSREHSCRLMSLGRQQCSREKPTQQRIQCSQDSFGSELILGEGLNITKAWEAGAAGRKKEMKANRTSEPGKIQRLQFPNEQELDLQLMASVAMCSWGHRSRWLEYPLYRDISRDTSKDLLAF